jgi:hypothetical protein
MFGNNKNVPELLFYQQPSRDALPEEETWGDPQQETTT